MGLERFDAEDLAVGGRDDEVFAGRRDAVRIAEEEDEGAGQEEEEQGQAATPRVPKRRASAAEGRMKRRPSLAIFTLAPQRSAQMCAARKASLAASAMMSGLIR